MGGYRSGGRNTVCPTRTVMYVKSYQPTKEHIMPTKKLTTPAKATTPKKIELLHITAQPDYIDVGCSRVWIRNNGDLCITEDYGGEMSPDCIENYERLMVTLYELAHRSGVKTPPNPYA